MPVLTLCCLRRQRRGIEGAKGSRLVLKYRGITKINRVRDQQDHLLDLIKTHTTHLPTKLHTSLINRYACIPLPRLSSTRHICRQSYKCRGPRTPSLSRQTPTKSKKKHEVRPGSRSSQFQTPVSRHATNPHFHLAVPHLLISQSWSPSVRSWPPSALSSPVTSRHRDSTQRLPSGS